MGGQQCCLLNNSAASLKALEIAGGPHTLELVSPSLLTPPSPLVPADCYAQAAEARVEHPEPCVAGVEVELLLRANMDRSADTRAVTVSRVVTHGIMTMLVVAEPRGGSRNLGCTADCTAGTTLQQSFAARSPAHLVSWTCGNTCEQGGG